MMRLGCFIILVLAMEVIPSQGLHLMRISEQIDGEIVNEVVMADEYEGLVVVTLTDVVENGVKFDEIMTIRDYNKGHYLLNVEREDEQICYVGELAQITSSSMEELLAKYSNGLLDGEGEKSDLQEKNEITSLELTKGYGKLFGRTCQDAERIVVLDAAPVGRVKSRRGWEGHADVNYDYRAGGWNAKVGVSYSW